MSLSYKRVMIKISGEALMGNQPQPHDLETIRKICRDIKKVHDLGIEVALVVGGGNILRGDSAAAAGMERASADYMGMLATVINSLALQNALELLGVETRVLSAIPMATVCEQYIRRKAIRHMQKRRIIIFAAGTGNPFFTTDTAATLRAIEMNCEALFKATQVDGVYCSDPKQNSQAKKFTKLSFKEVLNLDLRVMDSAAIALAKENHLPIIVFNLHEVDACYNILSNKSMNYTVIGEKS
jgi:uridylate kinase